VLYFTGRGDDTEEISPGNFVSGSGKREASLFSFCLRTHEFNEVAVLAEGYHSNASILGVFNNEIYISSSYNDKQYDITDPEFYKTRIDKNMVFSFRTGEISESDLYTYATITQEKYITIKNPDDSIDNHKWYALLQNGKEIPIDGAWSVGARYLFGDKLFNLYEGFGWDFAKSQLFIINDEFQGGFGDEVFYTFVTMYEGDYILERTTTVFSEPKENGDRYILERKYEFIRVSKTELIKETTS
jgi:hypothetical protein